MANTAPPPPPTNMALKTPKPSTQANSSGKIILILGRYAFPYHEWVDPQHVKVLFTSPESEGMFDSVAKRKYALIKYFPNYETNGNVEIEAIKLFENKTYEFTHVVFQAEQDIIRAARLKKALGLPGQTIDSALCFRDKCMMKEHLEKHMTPQQKEVVQIPAFAKVQHAPQLLKFVETHGYPLVVKPTRGMGSINTHIIKTRDDLAKLLSQGLSNTLDGPIDYQVEKFIFGQMYHIDGFVYKGDVKILYPSVYMNTCAGFKEASFLASYSLSEENPLTKRLQNAVVCVLSCMDAPPSYSFHVEIWHTPEDKLVLCEAACRTGGAGVENVMVQLFEVNLNKASIQSQCTDQVTSPIPSHWSEQKLFPSADSKYRNVGWIVVYPSPGKVLQYPKDCPMEYVLEYTHANVTDWGPDCRVHCTQAIGSFIVAGITENDVSKNIENTVQWYSSAIKWA